MIFYYTQLLHCEMDLAQEDRSTQLSNLPLTTLSQVLHHSYVGHQKHSSPTMGSAWKEE